MNIEQARTNMINQQLRTWDIFEPHLLSVIATTPREDFVDPQYRKLAFADTCIPLGNDQCMMPPREEGRLLQALNVQSTDLVLEVGTGSGYLTALLAKLSQHVLSVEIFPELSHKAKKHLAHHGTDNVTLTIGDAAYQWKTPGPFQVICITGSLSKKPLHYLNCLTIGGRLFAIIGQSPAMVATIFTRIDHDQWHRQSLFETVIPPLIHAEQPKTFEF